MSEELERDLSHEPPVSDGADDITLGDAQTARPEGFIPQYAPQPPQLPQQMFGQNPPVQQPYAPLQQYPQQASQQQHPQPYPQQQYPQQYAAPQYPRQPQQYQPQQPQSGGTYSPQQQPAQFAQPPIQEEPAVTAEPLPENVEPDIEPAADNGNDDERQDGALFSEETYYRAEAKDKKKRGGKGALVIFIILALLFAAAAGYFFWDSYKLKSEVGALNEKISAQETEIAALKNPPITDETQIPFKTIRELSDTVVSLTEFMSNFYPDHLVYYVEADDEIVYQPVDPSLARHSFDWSFLKDDPDEELNLKTYSDPNGVTAKKGIDVSTYQGSIDWDKVKADGVEFAFVRLGNRGWESGTIFEDDRCERNLAGANKAGVPVGVYFYSQAATNEEAVEEAEYIIDIIKDYEIQYPVVMDLEEENGETSRTKDLSVEQRTATVKAFCDRIAKEGYRPMIYANMGMLASKIDLTQLTGYEKWFAQYFSRPYFPYEFGIWQYTDEGKVDGIEGNVDLNLCFVDYVTGETEASAEAAAESEAE